MNERAVADVLERVLPGPVTVERWTPLTGGASATMAALDAVDGQGRAHRLVLRRTSEQGVGGLAVGARVEGLAMRAAAAAGVPVPTVLVTFERDRDLDDGYVMERLDGETLPRKLLRDDAYAIARERLINDCARALAAIQSVPPSQLDDEVRESPAAVQLELLESLHRSFGPPIPTFEVALRWLRAAMPEDAQTALVHGDFRNGNLLVAPDGLVAGRRQPALSVAE